MAKEEILFRQETGIFNKPNILIDIWTSNPLTTRQTKVYDVCLRTLLNQNRTQYQTNKIKTSISAIARAIGTSKREDIVDILHLLKKTRFKFNSTTEYNDPTTLISDFVIEKKGKKSLEIEFHSHLTGEVFKEIENTKHTEYTKIDLNEISRLKKMYSLPLYQLFRWKLADHTHQSKNYTEQELRDFLQLNNSHVDIKNFNRDVIKNAINDINTHTNLNISLFEMVKPKNGKPRTYKFKIYHDKTILSPKRFKAVIIKMAKGGTRIEWKRTQFEYVLASKWITGQDIDENDTLWAHKGSLKTAKTNIGITIWEELYLKYKSNPKTFLYDYLGMKVDELLEYEKRGRN